MGSKICTKDLKGFLNNFAHGLDFGKDSEFGNSLYNVLIHHENKTYKCQKIGIIINRIEKENLIKRVNRKYYFKFEMISSIKACDIELVNTSTSEPDSVMVDFKDLKRSLFSHYSPSLFEDILIEDITFKEMNIYSYSLEYLKKLDLSKVSVLNMDMNKMEASDMISTIKRFKKV